MNLYNVRMPHACPHLAAPVVEVPKVLVRGEAWSGRNRCDNVTVIVCFLIKVGVW